MVLPVRLTVCSPPVPLSEKTNCPVTLIRQPWGAKVTLAQQLCPWGRELVHDVEFNENEESPVTSIE
jgi:hypothetical protein